MPRTRRTSRAPSLLRRRPPSPSGALLSLVCCPRRACRTCAGVLAAPASLLHTAHPLHLLHGIEKAVGAAPLGARWPFAEENLARVIPWAALQFLLARPPWWAVPSRSPGHPASFAPSFIHACIAAFQFLHLHDPHAPFRTHHTEPIPTAPNPVLPGCGMRSGQRTRRTRWAASCLSSWPASRPTCRVRQRRRRLGLKWCSARMCLQADPAGGPAGAGRPA